VVLSLIYLSVQIRHNNQLAKKTSMQSVLESEIRFAEVLIDNVDVWNKIISGEPISDPIEERKGIILINLYMLDSSNRFHQWKSGFLEDHAWQGREKTLHSTVAFPLYTNWRKSLSAASHSQEFLAMLDAISEKSKKAGMETQGLPSTAVSH